MALVKSAITIVCRGNVILEHQNNCIEQTDTPQINCKIGLAFAASERSRMIGSIPSGRENRKIGSAFAVNYNTLSDTILGVSAPLRGSTNSSKITRGGEEPHPHLQPKRQPHLLISLDSTVSLVSAERPSYVRTNGTNAWDRCWSRPFGVNCC